MKKLVDQMKEAKKLFESVDPNFGYAEQDTNYWREHLDDAEPNCSLLQYVQKHPSKYINAQTIRDDFEQFKYFNPKGKLPKYFSIKVTKGGPKISITLKTAYELMSLSNDLPGYKQDHHYGSNSTYEMLEQLFNDGAVPLVDGSVIYASNS